MKINISFNLLDVRNFLKDYTIPKLLMVYTHKNDYTAEWLLKINEYYKSVNNNNIIITLNDKKNVSPHHNPFKDNNNLNKSIQTFINKIK